MKTQTIHAFLLSVLALFILTTLPVHAQSSSYGVSGNRSTSSGQSLWGLGVRRQIEHDTFLNLPFEDDDFSAGLCYEYHEANAYWQAALLWTPDPSSADYVITPSVSLIAKDNIWRGGLGLAMSYIKDQELADGTTEDDWTELYYQFSLGVNLPVFGRGVDFMAHYVFEEWDELQDFDFEDLEYGIWLKFAL